MPIAVETRRLTKSFRTGAGHCFASAHVLRDVDLAVLAGEALAIVGRPGAGKSTLMLCLAGLLSPDFGSVRWFGDASVSSAARHVLLHRSRADLLRFGQCDTPHLHLVDLERGFHGSELDDWIALRRYAGDAVVLAARPGAVLPADCALALLTDGRLRRGGYEAARVAERAI